MYKKLALCAIALMTAMTLHAQVKVGTNPTTIDPDAILEIESVNKGMRLPRVALTATNLSAPLAANVAGMMVYNTATAGSSPYGVSPGLYYNDGISWQPLGAAAASSGVGGTTLKTSDSGIMSVFGGRVLTGVDVGGAGPTVMAADGFITNVSAAKFGAGGTFFTVTMADQGTIDYDIFTSISAPVGTASLADGTNDFTFPLVFNKTPTSFQVFVEETTSTLQNVFLSFLLTKYTASAGGTHGLQKGQFALTTAFDIGAGTASYPAVTPASYSGFITNASFAQGPAGAGGSVITITMADQGTTDYDVYTSIKSAVTAYTGTGSADISNDFLFPLIFNKTKTGFQVFIQETIGNVQQVTFDFTLATSKTVVASPVPTPVGVPSTLLKGRIQTSIDVGGSSYPSAVYDGFITNAGFEYGGAGGLGFTVVTVYLPDQGTNTYEIFSSFQSGVIAVNDANGSNDFSFPLIFGKTNNSFKMFIQETISTLQQVKFSFVLAK